VAAGAHTGAPGRLASAALLFRTLKKKAAAAPSTRKKSRRTFKTIQAGNSSRVTICSSFTASLTGALK